MKRLIFFVLFISLFFVDSVAGFYGGWRWRTHATSCPSLTDGRARDICYEVDSSEVYKCEPTVNICSTSVEWKLIGSATTLEIVVVDFITDVTTGDGKAYIYIPAKLNGLVLYGVHAQVISVGLTGTTDIQIARCNAVISGDACSGTVNNMLSTAITIDSGEDSSDTAATPAVIDTSYDQASTNQLMRIDVDAVSSTEPKGLILTLLFIGE